jgi:hypothetical protein
VKVLVQHASYRPLSLLLVALRSLEARLRNRPRPRPETFGLGLCRSRCVPPSRCCSFLSLPPFLLPSSTMSAEAASNQCYSFAESGTLDMPRQQCAHCGDAQRDWRTCAAHCAARHSHGSRSEPTIRDDASCTMRMNALCVCIRSVANTARVPGVWRVPLTSASFPRRLAAHRASLLHFFASASFVSHLFVVVQAPAASAIAAASATARATPVCPVSLAPPVRTARHAPPAMPTLPRATTAATTSLRLARASSEMRVALRMVALPTPALPPRAPAAVPAAVRPARRSRSCAIPSRSRSRASMETTVSRQITVQRCTFMHAQLGQC